MKANILVGMGILAAGVNLSMASMMPGAEVKTWKANSARHTVMLTRTATNAIEKKMISVAENTPPTASKVNEKGSATAKPDSTITNWWCDTQCGIKIPYAITADAVNYYEKKVRSYQKKEWKRYSEPSSSYTYMAAVSFHETWNHEGIQFSNVYVVKMELRFNADFTEDGTTGIMFTKSRMVVLDKQGTVLRVYGDGMTEAQKVAI